MNQNFTVAPSQTVRVPGSGPKNPPGETVLVIVPKLLGAFVLPVVHTVPTALPGHPVFGLAKCGVLVRPKASALMSMDTRSVNLKVRDTLRFMLK